MIFVIGNGESRKDLDLNSLKEKGKTYGCNALYRDFSPDYLLSIDANIMVEILESGYCKNNQCYFSDWDLLPAEVYGGLSFNKEIHVGEKERARKVSIFGEGLGDEVFVAWINDENITSFPNSLLVDCGVCAIRIASEHNPNETVYLLGFDLKNNEDGTNNNIYKNTNCYSSLPRDESDKVGGYKRAIDAIKTIIEKNPDTSYCRVDDTGYNPWDDLHNVRCIGIADFVNEINK